LLFVIEKGYNASENIHDRNDMTSLVLRNHKLNKVGKKPFLGPLGSCRF
jgi:hypothetical protein